MGWMDWVFLLIAAAAGAVGAVVGMRLTRVVRRRRRLGVGPLEGNREPPDEHVEDVREDHPHGG